MFLNLGVVYLIPTTKLRLSNKHYIFCRKISYSKLNYNDKSVFQKGSNKVLAFVTTKDT